MPIVACIGRIVPIKDIKTFIRAIALIVAKIPRAEAWLIGNTQEDPTYTKSCLGLVKTLGLTQQVKFLGLQNIMEIFPKIDLVVLTSISEGSPFAILESFAVGIPVVSTDVGGCRELIEGKSAEDRAQGNAGRLISMADPKGLAEAVIELLTNETAWSRSQQIGLARVRQYYSMEQHSQMYHNIYKDAIEHGRHRV